MDVNDTLTPRQTLVWAEQQLDPEVPSNNYAMCFRIDGAIDAGRFDSAFARVVEETTTLRTVFTVANGHPRQHICRHVDHSVEHVDLEEPDLVAWLAERCVRRIDLERRAFDAALLTCGTDCTVFYLCQHHLICDAWSFSLIFRRLAAYYTDPDSELPAVPDYQRHIADAAAYHDSDRGRAAAAFWSDRLRQPSDEIAPYGVEARNKRPGLDRRIIDLGAERSAAWRALACREELATATPTLSVSMLFMTALAALLHRISGAEHIGIGFPVMNRSTRWSRDTPGLFMEICPFLIDVDLDDTFTTLHVRVVDEARNVLPHSRCTVSNPLHKKRFDVMFNFHNMALPEFAGHSVAGEIFNGLLHYHPSPGPGGAAGTAADTLVVQVLDFGGSGSYRICLDGNRDVLGDGALDRLGRHFERVIDSMLDDVGGLVNASEIVTAEELAHLLSERWHGKSYPAPFRSVSRSFHDRAEAHPERPALRFQDTVLSYAELYGDVARLAAELMSRGYGRADRIAVCVERSPGMVVALLAVLHAGCVYVPLDLSHPDARLAAIIRQARPAALICTADTGARAFAAGVPRVDPVSAAGAAIQTPAIVDSEDPAYVIFTSGSTGVPKGVEVTHRALHNLLASMSERPGFSESDRLMAVTTVAFDIAALELFLPLVCGGELCLVDDQTSRNPAALAAELRERGATVLQATPATWSMLVEAGWKGAADLRILCGGDRLSRELADQLLGFGGPVWNLYGPTETTIWSTCARVTDDQKPVPIGQPVAGTVLRILTAKGALTPAGSPGELCIGGAGLARGYLDRPDLDADRFVEDRYQSGERLYRTGDVVRLRPDGEIECMGRADFQVKIRGFRVETAEIESVLRASPEVRDAIVVATGGDPASRALAAFVVPANRSMPSFQDLEVFLGAHLPSYMVPRRWMAVEQLPLTTSGKVDRGALPVEALCATPRSGRPPANDLEVRVAALWREQLPGEAGDRQTDFFAAGGNSLLAVRLLGRIEAELGGSVAFADFFAGPTIAGLARAVADTQSSIRLCTAVPLNTPDRGTPLFCMGGVHLYQALARALDGVVPVYGVYLPEEQQWRHPGIAAITPAELVAASYVDAVRQIWPEGPYRLGGLSYGGVIAYEMARQLTDVGEEVEALVLMDVRLPGAIAAGQGWSRRLRYRLRSVLRHPLAGDHLDAALVRAVGRYEESIQQYGGDALLLRALDQSRLQRERDFTLGWGRLILGGIEVHDCPGDHLGILMPENVATAAAAVAGYVARLSGDAEAHALSNTSWPSRSAATFRGRTPPPIWR